MSLVRTMVLSAFSLLVIPPAVLADAIPGIIEHGPRDAKKIALTFDACPTNIEDEYDEQVVSLLIAEKVPATLFLSGRWVEKNPEKTKFLAAQPQFELGNHAYWHPHLMEKDDERVLRELKRTQAIIRKITGGKPHFFRPPYGEVDERIVKLANEAGLETIQYDMASGDPDPALSPKRIVRAVLAEAKGGSIIVFHMNRKGLHTAEVLPEVIKGLRERGYELVTVGVLLQGEAGKVRKARRKEGGTIGSCLPSHSPTLFPR